jgi:hypothetical protein
LIEVYEDLDWSTYIALTDELCKIQGNIQDELTNHARIYAYYAGMYEIAKKDVEKQEIALERSLADARNRATDSLQSRGSRATVAAVDNEATMDGDVQHQQDRLNDIKYKLGLLRSLTSALSHKKDMLVQLSSNERAEKKLYS